MGSLQRIPVFYNEAIRIASIENVIEGARRVTSDIEKWTLRPLIPGRDDLYYLKFWPGSCGEGRVGGRFS